MTAKKQRYAVLAEAKVSVDLVLLAESPEDAVQKARFIPTRYWETLDDWRRDDSDSVTERRKNGRAFSVEDDGRCVEVEELPW